MESARKKRVVGDEVVEGHGGGGDGGDGGESSESVVLQCGAVEQGEEVAMGAPPPTTTSTTPLPYNTDKHGSLTVGGKTGDKEEDACVEDAVMSVRSLDGRKIILTPRMVSCQNDGGYWRLGARRRCRARKSSMHGPFGVNASFVVERAAVKRKQEEVKQCSPERHESDDSASSSDSDASDSESEQWRKRRNTSSKRRRRSGDDVTGKSPSSSLQLRSGGRQQPPGLVAPDEEAAAAAEYDDELKEMQQLLELQLQAAEKREAGMKQRMEMMMDVLSQHMGHVEKRVSNLEDGAHPHEQVLERINVKLEKVMEGFSALNENLCILSACLSKNLDSQ